VKVKTVRLKIDDPVRVSETLASEYAGASGVIVAIEERQAGVITLAECEVEFNDGVPAAVSRISIVAHFRGRSCGLMSATNVGRNCRTRVKRANRLRAIGGERRTRHL
jgi:hypothetical protein